MSQNGTLDLYSKAGNLFQPPSIGKIDNWLVQIYHWWNFWNIDMEFLPLSSLLSKYNGVSCVLCLVNAAFTIVQFF